jgi:hypothetical protein
MRLNMKRVFLILVVTFLFLGFFYFASFFVLPEKTNNFYTNNNFGKNYKNEIQKPLYLKTIPDIKKDLVSKGKSFLEINLPAMKVRLYKDGKLKKEASILTIGDPQGWGGSALGLYKVMSGNELSFSVISNVYMPYALRYYGKYYLHGEPFYQDGRKLDSSVSGGCVRIPDKEAKEFYELSELQMPVLIIGKEKDYYQFSLDNPSEFPEVSAKSYLVVDLDSGFVFKERNRQEQLPLASLTKLMTAIVVAENIDLRKSILVEERMLESYGATEGLEPGRRLRVVELFYPLLIESSNDAANVLSYFLGSQKTIEMMNEKAKAILMNRTRFVDPHGFGPNNVSTAEDVFQLVRYISNTRPPLFKITKSQEVTSFGEVGFDIKQLWNKNIFIKDPTFVGGKTGYLKESKYNGVFVFKFGTKDNEFRDVAIILLESEDLKSDVQRIHKWLRENYSLSPSSQDLND